jgi:hypothetical protein
MRYIEAWSYGRQCENPCETSSGASLTWWEEEREGVGLALPRQNNVSFLLRTLALWILSFSICGFCRIPLKKSISRAERAHMQSYCSTDTPAWVGARLLAFCGSPTEKPAGR